MDRSPQWALWVTHAVTRERAGQGAEEGLPEPAERAGRILVAAPLKG